MKQGSNWYRSIVLYVADRSFVEQLAVKHGRKLARKFIASDTRHGALEVVKSLNQLGIMVTLDVVGEAVTQLDEARAYRDEYVHLMEEIARRQVNANVSLKPTQMGLALDSEACYNHIHEIVSQAHRFDNFVRIDMEV